MSGPIHQDMIQSKGAAYSSDRIKSYSHYREPVDHSSGRLAGNSRIWGDASPEVQSRVIDTLIEVAREKNLTPRETAHVLAIARVESGFNPDAAAGTTSASGLGQFVDRTGKAYGLNNENRFEVKASADALVGHFIDNRNLAKIRGQGEEYIYKYHHDGPTSDYGGLDLSKQKVSPYINRYESFVEQRLTQLGMAPTPTTTTPPSPPREAGRPDPGATLLNETLQHFQRSGQQFEYGRGDTVLKAGNDRSRLEQDLDGDGKRGVDCSSLVWRGLKNAGFNVPGDTAANFTTQTLFSGKTLTSFAKQNFDGISAADARQPNGDLKPGDLLLFKSKGGSGQHIAIFEGYDTQGRIKFYGSQVSTGPASVTVKPGGYWDGAEVEIVGALRPKAEFQTRAPVHVNQTAGNMPARASSPADTLLRDGSRGADVKDLQEKLNQLGIKDANGRPLQTDSRFGPATESAVEAFQRRAGLRVDGVVGPKTEAALVNSLAALKTQAVAAPNFQDNAVYQSLQQRFPAGTSPEHLLHATALAGKIGIHSPEQLSQVVVRDNVVHFSSATPGMRDSINLSQPAPSLEQSQLALQQSNDQQQLQQHRSHSVA